MKKFVTIIAVLACAYLIYCFFFGSLGNAETKPSTATITADQGIRYEQLAHVRKGDIVIDPTGTLCGIPAKAQANTHVLVVTSGDINGCRLKGVHMPLPSYFSFEDLARHNCRVVRHETQEWHDAMIGEYTKNIF